MQKRGFTLIELLAVIVVLAIIAVIATPMVLNTIEEAKKGAAKADAYVYAAEVERYMVLAQMDPTKPQLQAGVTYQLSSQKYEIASLADPNEVFINDLVQIKGEKPTSGYVILNSNGKIEKMEMVMSSYQIECENDNCNIKGEIVPEPACEYESGYVWEFDYATNESGEGIEQTFTVPCRGTYKLETWGAQGGNASSVLGGYGSYSTGDIELNKKQLLYINVGGAGENGTKSSGRYIYKGGYNGGGDGNNGNCDHIEAGGGGATHIATTSGVLSTLENNIDSILIVSGGGGAAHVNTWRGSYNASGGAAGGYTSVGRTPATQESGHAFGQGQTVGACEGTGGGGGFYGGVKGANSTQSSGGSGYIGSSLLTNKHMSCYNCETSDEVSTKTISTTNASDEPISDYAKKGSGYAKITFIGEN